MAQANPRWGAPRIHGEWLTLGIEIGQTTVAKYMPRRSRSPSQGWRTFLRHHLHETVAIDCAVVPTVTFRLLFTCVVLGLDRRRVLHVNVTANPTAAWTAQQLVEAFPWETTPRYVIRDRDRSSGRVFRQRVAGLGVGEVITAWRSPGQNGYVERFIGSLRRELLDHFIVLDEPHLRGLLRKYVRYYNRSRTPLALVKDAPERREVVKTKGRVIARPEVGGLRHRYERLAA
jgi:transposase InsO family protein